MIAWVVISCVAFEYTLRLDYYQIRPWAADGSRTHITGLEVEYNKPLYDSRIKIIPVTFLKSIFMDLNHHLGLSRPAL